MFIRHDDHCPRNLLVVVVVWGYKEIYCAKVVQRISRKAQGPEDSAGQCTNMPSRWIVRMRNCAATEFGASQRLRTAAQWECSAHFPDNHLLVNDKNSRAETRSHRRSIEAKSVRFSFVIRAQALAIDRKYFLLCVAPEVAPHEHGNWDSNTRFQFSFATTTAIY